MADKEPEVKLKSTRSPCPTCNRFVDADIVLRGASLHMIRRCPEHGAFDLLYRRNFRFYDSVSSVVHCTGASDDPQLPRKGSSRDVSIVYIDVTERCNLACPVCYADSGASAGKDMPIETMIDRLTAWEGKKPTVYLSGGEPTLRKDLPEIISRIMGLGLNTIMLTNGIKLADDGYVRTLKEAGLRFLVLQFDGLTDDVYEKIRGRRLLDLKMKALDNLARHEIMASICAMVVPGVNDHQVGDLVRFGVGRKFIYEVEFMPAEKVGRADEEMVAHEMDADEVMDLMHAQTGGRIGQTDFLASMKFLNRLHKATGMLRFRPKVCIHNCPVIGSARDFRPALWYLNPANLLRNPRSLGPIRYISRNLFDMQKKVFPKTLTVIAVTNLFNMRTITADDVNMCNLVFMTEHGYLPGCMYWLILRRGCAMGA